MNQATHLGEGTWPGGLTAWRFAASGGLLLRRSMMDSELLFENGFEFGGAAALADHVHVRASGLDFFRRRRVAAATLALSGLAAKAAFPGGRNLGVSCEGNAEAMAVGAVEIRRLPRARSVFRSFS